MLDAVRKAMDAIPQERRRLLRSRFNLGDGFYACLKKALKNPKPQSGFPNGAAPAAQDEPAPAPVLSPTIVAATSGALLAKSPASLDELPTEALVSALVMRLMRGLERQGSAVNPTALEQRMKEQEQFAELLTAELADVKKEMEAMRPNLREPIIETPVEAPKPEPGKIHRVAILGCRKDQFDIINEEAKEQKLPVELRHYEQDSHLRRVGEEWAISLRWIKHAWEDQVKQTVPKGQYIFLRGGVMAAVQQLRVWFAPEIPQSES